MQPRAGIGPGVLGRPDGDTEGLGDLAHVQAHEKPQFDEIGGCGVDFRQAIKQLIPGAQRFEIEAGGGASAGAGGRARNHPAVQAALNVFQGEVVAVRPRAPEEGESS